MKRFLVFSGLLLLFSVAAAAADKETKTQTIKALGVEFTLKDSMQWDTVNMTNGAALTSEEAKVGIVIMPSPLRDCGKVMSRLGGNTPNKSADKWYKTMLHKGDSLSLCIDVKNTTYLATISGLNDLNGPVFDNVNALMSALGKALKK